MWTSEADDEMRLLKAAGLTFGQIAKRMGVSRSAAIGRFQRHFNGKKYGRSLPALRRSQEAAERRAERKRGKERQKERQIEELRKELASVTSRHMRNFYILAAHAAGMSNGAIGRAVGITKERISQILLEARRPQQAASRQFEQRGEMN
jgi:hypothetical protein